ncbi:MAG TPA: beta-ketoacyl-ACP synthase II [Bacillota bacterium]|nr:beta-ketoacyl-ACP synthase II [Bacillota bacterium]
MKRRVVVTGIGTINPIGNDAKTTWENAKKGVNGIDFISRFDASEDDVKVAGEVKGFDFESYLGTKQIKRMDRFVQMAMVASNEAIEDSGIDFSDFDKDRVGVYYASGIGGLEMIVNQNEKALEKGYRRLSPFFIPSTIINIAAGNIAIEHKIYGSVLSNVTACASSTNSIGEAFRAIRDGYLDAIVTGGSESTIIPLSVWGFSVMQALSKADDPNKASIPFDVNRNGFVIAEGGATLVLEELEHAKKRGAKIYAEMVGYGSTCDASHITSPDPEGDGARRCMLMALNDAGINPEEVDYINAHGTSTPLNDKTETMAIKSAFGQHAYELNVSSTKSMTGHLLGATGALEAIFSVMSVKEDFIPPTINTETLDPECDLNYTLGHGVTRSVNIAISNSLGFGGHNATIAFKKYKGE